MQGSAVGVGIMGHIGKGLRAASFPSTEVLPRPGEKVPEMAGKGQIRGLCLITAQHRWHARKEGTSS